MKRKLRLPSMENPESRHEFTRLANKVIGFHVSAKQFGALSYEQLLPNSL